MIASPVLALVAPDWLPATILLVGFAVGAGSIASDFRAVVPKDLPPGFAGRLLGAIIAAWIATEVVGKPILPLIVGGMVWFAVLLSIAGLRLPIMAPTLFGSGTVAGVMGTLTGIGAPPMAILYANVEARRSAATQNAFFAFGMVVSIGALIAVGLVGLRHIALAASLVLLVPPTLWLLRPVAERIGGRSVRPVALSLAALAATVLILRNWP